MKSFLVLGALASSAVAFSAQASVSLDCGSFMQDPISIEISGGEAKVLAPDILNGGTRSLKFSGNDGQTISFADNFNIYPKGKPFYSSLSLKVPANLEQLQSGSKLQLALIERYSERLSDPGVPNDWKPKCVVK